MPINNLYNYKIELKQIHQLSQLSEVMNIALTEVRKNLKSELLQQLATQVAIAIQQSELYQQLQLANKQLENIAMVDQLTQIANRRRFDSKLEYVWRYLLRNQSCVSLLLCDIDYFKQYNDTYWRV